MFPSVINFIKIKYIDESNHYNNTSFFDGIVAKLNATSIQLGEVTAKVEDIDEYVGELQQGEVMLVQPMLTAKIYDDEAGE